MRSHRIRRFLTITAVIALGLAGSGTGTRVQMAAIIYGIDPLEVLKVRVRPNVILVLDTSGSMRDTGRGGDLTGNDPRSKMMMAKTAMTQLVQDNQDKASFMLGKYTGGATAVLPLFDRFLYTTDSFASPSMDTTEIIINPGSSGSPPGLRRDSTPLSFSSGAYKFLGNSSDIIYIMHASRFFNGETVRVLANGTYCDMSVGPGGNPAFVRLQQVVACGGATIGPAVTFTFSGVPTWGGVGAGGTCMGFEQTVPLAPCSQNLQLEAMLGPLAPEVGILPNGSIEGYSEGGPPAYSVLSQPTFKGVRTTGFTPIANSLRQIKTLFTGLYSSVIAAQVHKQRTFVIFLTDGDDTCPGPGGSSDQGVAREDERALGAAYNAQLLRQELAAGVPESGVTTFVVAFGNSVSRRTADWIAWGGSGMDRPAVMENYDPGTSDDFLRWAGPPTATDRALCTNCTDAFAAANAIQLTQALQAALDRVLTVGHFSASPSASESVYELAPSAPLAAGTPIPNALDPTTRFSVLAPLEVVPSFVMPDFRGHLRGFVRDSAGQSAEVWDAADQLYARVATNGLLPGFTTGWTFAELTGGASWTNIETSAAKLKRRIFATTRNGVFDTNAVALIDRASPGRVALWPPDASVDPSGAGWPAGVLDDALGIGAGSTPVLALGSLQLTFGACQGASLPTECTTAVSFSTRTAAARREARQIILAHAAGAVLVRDGTGPVRRVPGGALQFRPREAILADSTLSAPAIVGPPLQQEPLEHRAEYRLFRDGVRSAANVGQPALDQGFGLRNPDLDANSPAPGTSDPRLNLKPAATVVYYGSNHMLHAFRAGPCPPATCSEVGGEEMWAFVPFDQLGKLADRMRVQDVPNHTYVLSASLRFGDVFVPASGGAFSRTIGSETVTGAGVWRTVLMFGRGPGGKYMTALDVTAPASVATASLSTHPPIALWSRGNPDTVDGKPAGPSNHDAPDRAAYATMGQTWSTPALAFVDATANATARRPAGVEFVAYAGSGFGDGSNAATEGRTFYVLDALTGDVVGSRDVGERGGSGFSNAIVANVAAYNTAVLKAGPFGNHPWAARTTRAYVGDIHGRVWKFLAGMPGQGVEFFDMGAGQPVTAAVSLATSPVAPGTPVLFAESGGDIRVPPDGPFRMVGLRDQASNDELASGAMLLWSLDFPQLFRGVAQPAVAFAQPQGAAPQLRVFFLGRRGGVVEGCYSTFDSTVFAVGGLTGEAAYDLNTSSSDLNVVIRGQFVGAVSVNRGVLNLDRGLKANLPPDGPAPPIVLGTGTSAPQTLTLKKVKHGTGVCR